MSLSGRRILTTLSTLTKEILASIFRLRIAKITIAKSS